MASADHRANVLGVSVMDETKLVTMLNQIATFYRRRPPEQAASEIALHVEKFWEPRMRRAIYAHLDAGGAGLENNARDALVLMRERDEGRAPFEPRDQSQLRGPLEA